MSTKFLSIQAQDFIEDVIDWDRPTKAEFLSIQAQDFIEDRIRRGMREPILDS